MSITYRYDHRSVKQRRKRIFGVLLGFVLIIGLIAGVIFWDLKSGKDTSVEGDTKTITQVASEGVQRFTVDEQFYTFELPGDWKEVSRKNTATENSITWQATKSNEDNRFMTIYTDTIPPRKALNRLVPLTAQGNMVSAGDVSDNCSTFTAGGTLVNPDFQKLSPTPAKYQKVDFICNLPNPHENEIGTGSTEGLNAVTITGPSKGPHKYFFLYTDHNVQPNYMIFTEVLRSFRAK
jgi:hypothetical protein